MSDIKMIITLPDGLLQDDNDDNEGYFNAHLLQTRDKLIRDLVKLETETEINRNKPHMRILPEYWILKTTEENRILSDLMGVLLTIEGRSEKHLIIAFDLCNLKG